MFHMDIIWNSCTFFFSFFFFEFFVYSVFFGSYSAKAIGEKHRCKRKDFFFFFLLVCLFIAETARYLLEGLRVFEEE
jgi:hypothetical protein